MKKTFQRTVSWLCAVLLFITAVPFGVFAESGAQAGDVLYRAENGMEACVTPDGYFVSAVEYDASVQDYVQTVTYLDKSFHVQSKITVPYGKYYSNMRPEEKANAVALLDSENQTAFYLFANGKTYEIPDGVSISGDVDTSCVAVGKDGLFGVADKNGDLVVSCDYTAISMASCGGQNFFIAHRNDDAGGLWDFVTDLYAEDGTLLLQELTECYTVGENCFKLFVRDEEKYKLYFPKSGEMHMAWSDEEKNGFIPYQGENGLIGFLDAQGHICVPAQYDDVGSFSAEGLVWVRDAEAQVYSYINTAGKQAFPAQYERVTDFVNGYAVVEDKTAGSPYIYRLIDSKGNTVKKYTSDKEVYFRDFDGDCVIVEKEGLYGVANIKGEMVMPFTELDSLWQTGTPNVYWVFTASGIPMFYHTKTGQYYSGIRSLSHSGDMYDMYALQDANGKWAGLNANGDIVTPFIYDEGADGNYLYLDGEPYIFTNDGTAYHCGSMYYLNGATVATVKNADGSLSFLNLQTDDFLFDREKFDVKQGWGGRDEIESFGNGKLMLKTTAGEYIFADVKEDVITARHTGFSDIAGNATWSGVPSYLIGGGVALRTDGTVSGYCPEPANGGFLGYDESTNIFIVLLYEDWEAGTTRIDFIKGHEYNIDHIEICTPPKQTSFTEGIDGEKCPFMDENGQEKTYWYYPIDWQGAELKVVYTDGTSEILPVDGNRDKIIIDDNQSESTAWNSGTHTVSVYYFGQKTEVRFEVLENPIQSIELVQMPTVTQYLLGQHANLDGAVLQINYKNGTVKQLPLSQAPYQSVYDAVCGCEVKLYYDWSAEGVVTIEYAGVEATAEFDITEVRAESIEICGGNDTCLTITVTLSDGSKLDMVCYGGDWETVITDKGTFEGEISYDIKTDSSGKAYKTNISVSLFGVTSNTLATCRQLDAYDQFLEMYNTVDCFASDSFAFFGKMTKENADDLATVAFHMWASGLDEQALEHIQNADGTWSVAVPRAMMDTAAKKIFGLENPDWTLCSNYTAATETFLFPAEGGHGYSFVNCTAQTEKDGWRFVCDGMTIFVRSDMTIGEVYFGERTVMPGDINNDGKITAVDARWALQAASGSRTFTAEQIAAADVNGDGKITATDARWILQAVSGERVL